MLHSKLVILLLYCIFSFNIAHAQQANGARPQNQNTPPPRVRNNDRPTERIQNERPNRQQTNITDLTNVEQNLQTLISELEITPIETSTLNLPNIEEPVPILGKKLFFAKNLGGEQSVACVSCHHPMLGGGDNLSLSVGVDAVNNIDLESHDLLGIGRFSHNDELNLPVIPRNAPTVFNLGLNTRSLFWDSALERRRNGRILSPESPVDAEGNREFDPNIEQNTTLAAAQARFPVTSVEEMRGEFGEGQDGQELRQSITSRFNNQNTEFDSTWPIEFEQAFGNSEVNFARIAQAIGEYERSMVFVNNPWQAYLKGDSAALSDSQKAGALLFYTPRNEGGAGCASCHSGDTFKGRRHRLVAYPQIGIGKGNESATDTSHDFGRMNITNNEEDKFHFIAPSLLNIEVTAPYGHSGAYQSLEEVIRHYVNPRQAIERLFGVENNQVLANEDAPICQLPQVLALIQKNGQNCEDIFADGYINSIEVIDHLEQARNQGIQARAPLRPMRNLSTTAVSQLVDFLKAQTDPCVKSRTCLAPWIIDENDEAEYPDSSPLISINEEGALL